MQYKLLPLDYNLVKHTLKNTGLCSNPAYYEYENIIFFLIFFNAFNNANRALSAYLNASF